MLNKKHADCFEDCTPEGLVQLAEKEVEIADTEINRSFFSSEPRLPEAWGAVEDLHAKGDGCVPLAKCL